MANAIKAHAELMRSVDDAEVLVGGKTLAVAIRRDPALVVADIRVAADGKERQTAFPRVRPIGSGDAEYIRPPVLADVSALTDMPHPGETIRRVVQLGGAEAVCVAYRGKVYGRIA